MRRSMCVRGALLCALAAVAAIPASASAAPRHDRGLTIAATPNPIVAGTGVLIYGQLTGSDVADQTIHLYHRIANAKKFTLVSTTTTNQSGYYEFTRAEGVVLTNRNWYAVGPDSSHSKTIHERVASTLTLNESSDSTTTGQKILLSGALYPTIRDQRVLIQKQDSATGNEWATVASGRTNAAGDFSIAHSFRDAGDYTLRAYVPSNVRNIAGSSDAVTLAVQQTQAPSFTINSSAPSITVGQPATISGVVYDAGSTTTPDGAVPVALYADTAGHGFKELATTVTGTDGSYSFLETPANNTVYKVQTATSPIRRSADLFEGVADTVSLSASASSATVGTPVTFAGTVSPDHAGHAIYLQVQTAKGGWQDVAAQKVGATSRYSFSYAFGQPGTYTVRARIFGGPENVGAGSAPVTITVAGYALAATLAPATS